MPGLRIQINYYAYFETKLPVTNSITLCFAVTYIYGHIHVYVTYFRVLLWVDKTKTKSWSSECEYQSYTYSTVKLEGGVVESKSVIYPL